MFSLTIMAEYFSIFIIFLCFCKAPNSAIDSDLNPALSLSFTL